MAEENKGLNWKQILVTAVVTGIIGLSVGMLLFQFQQQQPQLSYEVTDTIPFMGDKERLAIHNIVIRNGGNAFVKNVDCNISVSPAVVKEKRVSAEPSLKYSDSVNGSKYDIHINNINPEEKITISILSSGQNEIPIRPTVSLRSEGFIGKASIEPSKKSFWASLFPPLISAYAVAIALFAVVRWRKDRSLAGIFKLNDDDSFHTGDQNKILAYLFGLRGLISEAEIYLQKTQESHYWSEADRIAAIAINTSDPAKMEVLKHILMDILKYSNVTKSSAAIIHYNIARISKVQNQDEECEEHLEEARKTMPKLLGKRLQLDPVFINKMHNESPPIIV